MDATTLAVVDTDVISFLFKNHSLAPPYRAVLAGRPLSVSLITLADIEYGLEAKKWGRQPARPYASFSRFTPLLPDTETTQLWARVKSGCEKKGRPITFADAWIAAAAFQLNAPSLPTTPAITAPWKG